MEHLGSSFVMLFADVNLAGAMTGVQLAAMARQRFRGVNVVVTSGSDQPALPGDTVFLKKPWHSLDILREAERALRH
jgi:hypothetical protein